MKKINKKDRNIVRKQKNKEIRIKCLTSPKITSNNIATLNQKRMLKIMEKNTKTKKKMKKKYKNKKTRYNIFKVSCLHEKSIL